LKVVDYLLAFAVEEATPRPDAELTAKALATHDVIVSGIVVFIVTVPSALKYQTIS
jgi:hypothetical protein